LEKIVGLAEIASSRGQSLAQMAVAWTLRDTRVTSTLIGASSVRQLEENVAALNASVFTEAELGQIDKFATESGVNLWAESAAY
jgi:L-glyceraldehyde 3-phosphate reductase